MVLRPYQTACVDAIFEDWKSHNSTLFVLPTGCGKTICLAEVIKRVHPGRALVLAHREELIFQNARKIEAHTGLGCEIEMADLKASATFWNRSPVIISTIQTQNAGSNGNTRMKRFDPNSFDVLIIDEAHHSPADSYGKVIAHYRQNPNLKVLGCTATPDRADEEALGQVFESVAFDYELLDAIHDGYLVPISQQMVTIEGLDFSHIRTTAGDLNGADLAEVMEAEKTCQGVAGASIEIIGDKRTLIFTSSVHHAEQLAQIFNRHRTGMARWACASTPKDVRRELLKAYTAGDVQVICNCGLFGEGFDEPGVQIVIQARPTKSRCLYAQQCGRGTRPLAGIIDGLDTPELRKEAIAKSYKPSLLVVDFSGNSGRHKLISTADILGGNVSEEAVERAERRAKEAGTAVRMAELLEDEEEKIRLEIERRHHEEELRKARVVAKARYTKTVVDPFGAYDLMPARERGWDKGKPISEGMAKLLHKVGIDTSNLSYAQARQLCAEQIRRWKEKLCTAGQANLLKKFGYMDTKDLKFVDASARITKLKENGWQRPADEVEAVPVSETNGDVDIW